MSLDQTRIRHDMLYEFKKGPWETEVGRNSRSAKSVPGHSKDDLDSIDWKLFPSEIPLDLDAQVLSILNFRNLQKTLSKMQENSQKQFNIHNTSIIKDPFMTSAKCLTLVNVSHIICLLFILINWLPPIGHWRAGLLLKRCLIASPTSDTKGWGLYNHIQRKR